MKPEIFQVPGYTIFRKLGSGGFGTVYLAERENAAGFVALKIIRTQNARRERLALEKYARVPARDGWAEIIDWGDIGDAVFYAMPLADALPGSEHFSPKDFRWQEASLQKIIERRLSDPHVAWFSRKEILDLIEPVFDAAIRLGENALLHRDIKPANILVFGGKTKLADFGLLDNDHRSLTRIGTPLYSAPSWFAGSGGNPDAYGLATTFYSLITGNFPDTIGRAAYRFPEKWREETVPEALREQWMHWNRCILRSIAESPAERFVTLEDFKKAIFSEDFRSSRCFGTQTAEAPRRFPLKKAGLGVLAFALLAAGTWGIAEMLRRGNDSGKLRIVQLSRTLSPGTQNYFSGKGRISEVLVEGRGVRELSVEAPFVLDTVKVRAGGELRIAGTLDSEPRLEMYMSGSEYIVFEKNPEQDGTTFYTLDSIGISGSSDAFPKPNIIIDKGVSVRLNGGLSYDFHADIVVDGTLIADNIAGSYFIDFFGKGIVRTNAILGKPEGITMHDGVRAEIGKGGISHGGKTVLFNATIAVAESWVSPATQIRLDSPAGTIFELQAADGAPTAAEIAGAVSGEGKLIKTGSGTLMLSGENTYRGGTEVRAGVLAAGTPSALGGDNAKLLLTGSGRVRLGAEQKSVRLAPAEIALELSGFYEENAAVFGKGTLAAGSLLIRVSDEYLKQLEKSGIGLRRYKIADSGITLAKHPSLRLAENLESGAWRAYFSNGILTLFREQAPANAAP